MFFFGFLLLALNYFALPSVEYLVLLLFSPVVKNTRY